MFDGMKDGIVNAFKTVVNTLIRGINKVIATPFNKVNSLLNNIRNINILGATPFSGLWGYNPLPVPQIPQFKYGNVATTQTLGIFGEYSGAKSNPEITTPQSIIYQTVSDVIKDNSESFGKNTDSKQPINLVVKFADRTIFEEFIDYANTKTRRNGVSVFVGG